MTFDAEICALTRRFYEAYPEREYPELMRKQGRPYTCLLIDTHDSYLICIPFRTSIKHNEAFLFSGTERSSRSRSGLDYKKLVLIKDNTYINRSDVQVDRDEYKAVVRNLRKIARQADDYISVYVDHVNASRVLHSREYKRKYEYSTLPYFHDILDLP